MFVIIFCFTVLLFSAFFMYFRYFLFLLYKSGGAKAPPAPPSARSLSCDLQTHDPRNSRSNWNLEVFLWRAENQRTRRKTSWSRDDNQQQTHHAYEAGFWNQTRATLVGGERSHHYAIPGPRSLSLYQISSYFR